MSIVRNHAVKLFLTAVTIGVFCPQAQAEVVPLDLLSGWGDFEMASPVTRWDTLNNTPLSYDYRSVWPAMRLRTPNDTLAVGWKRASGAGIHPLGDNLVCKLVPSGIGGSKCQYFAVKGLNAWDWAAIVAVAFTDRYGTASLQAGDKVVFKVDHIRVSGFQGADAACWLRVRTPGGEAVETIELSETPKSAEATLVVAGTESRIVAEVFVSANHGGGAVETGVYVDGAHLHVIRSGQNSFETRQIPAPRNRSIKTAAMFWHPERVALHKSAEEYDYLIVADNSVLNLVPIVKSLNPSIKAYLYQTSRVVRTGDGSRDDYYSNAPIGYRYVVDNHPEWLYTDGVNVGSYLTDTYYLNTYQTRRFLAAFQDAWVSSVLTRVQFAGLDGVFIDDLEELSRKPAGDGLPVVVPEVAGWEIQKFIHAAVPRFRSEGLSVIKNGCRQLLETGQGQVFMDPFWQPGGNRPASEGYAANSPDNTPQATFQEWAFFSPSSSGAAVNRYDKAYWLQCLRDMDTVARWNTAIGPQALPDGRKKMLFVNVRGSDSVNDPAYGLDGWLRFGLCSYLLGQNDWTVFSCGLKSQVITQNYHANMDYSITKKLGFPDGDHAAINGDEYFRSRRYVPGPDGGVGGVVVVNAHTDANRQYTLPFSATDESGASIPRGTVITLKPHTGRIFFRPADQLTINVSSPTAGVAPGDTVTVTIDYGNTGSNEILDAVVRARVPEGTQYVSGSAEQTGGYYDMANGSVSWIVSSVVPGEAGARVFKAKVL